MRSLALWSCLLGADAAASRPPRRMRTAPVSATDGSEPPQRPVFGGRSSRTLRKDDMIPISAPLEGNEELGFLSEAASTTTTAATALALEDMSMSAPAIEAHVAAVEMELSMSAPALEVHALDDEGWSNDAAALLELSMSMMADIEAHDITLSELSMSMKTEFLEVDSNDVAPLELSLSLSMSLPTTTDGPAAVTYEPTTPWPSYVPTKAPAASQPLTPNSFAAPTDVVALELTSSLSMSLPTTTTDSPSTPWPSYVPTRAPAVSRPLNQNAFDAPTRAPAKGQEVGHPLLQNAFSMNPSTAPTKAPIVNSKAAKTKAPTTEAPSDAPTPHPTASPTTAPTVAAPVTPSPTHAPTASPVAAAEIELATSVRLQLVDMSGVMDAEATGVFEQSCGEFLEGNLGDYEPPIYGVQCDVVEQAVDAGRRLGEGETGRSVRGRRRLQTAPLNVTVNVTGSVAATSSVNDASDVPFDVLVYNSFNVYSSTFVGQLTADGAEASIDDFDNLSAVYAIKDLPSDGGNPSGGSSSAAKNPDGTTSGGSDNGSNNTATNGIIAAIALCGAALLGLFAGYFYHVGRRQKEATNDALSEGSDAEIVDVYDASLADAAEPGARTKRSFETESHPGSTTYNLGVIAQNSTMGRSDDRDAMTYQYSLDDGLASPRSYSQPGASPTSTVSLTDHFAHQTTSFLGGRAPNRIRKDIVAPQGKLGIIIDTCSEGPIVHSVKPTSPLQGLIFKGDLVVAVDGEDTREWSAHYLTKLVAKKSREERKFTVLRTVVEGVEQEQEERGGGEEGGGVEEETSKEDASDVDSLEDNGDVTEGEEERASLEEGAVLVS